MFFLSGGGHEVASTTVSFDTDLSRAQYLGEDLAGYCFPATVEYEGNTFDFADASAQPDFRGIGTVTLRLIQKGVATEALMPTDVCRGITKFMRTARWGDDTCDCTAFALGATNTKLRQIVEPAAYTPVADPSALCAGDLLAIGRVRFGNRDIDHYAVAFGGGGMALNVTGKGGRLAATPLDHLPAIYPKSSLYRVGVGRARG